jgi:fluoride exporter
MPAPTTLPPLILIAFGGAFGACLRYLVGRWSLVTFGPGLPLGTWIVNISGGLAIGLLAGWIGRMNDGGEELRLLLGVGVLGGFTTFSAFSLELVTMVNRGEVGLAAAYAVSSVAGAMLAVFTGIWLARA